MSNSVVSDLAMPDERGMLMIFVNEAPYSGNKELGIETLIQLCPKCMGG